MQFDLIKLAFALDAYRPTRRLSREALPNSRQNTSPAGPMTTQERRNWDDLVVRVPAATVPKP